MGAYVTVRQTMCEKFCDSGNRIILIRMKVNSSLLFEQATSQNVCALHSHARTRLTLQSLSTPIVPIYILCHAYTMSVPRMNTVRTYHSEAIQTMGFAVRIHAPRTQSCILKGTTIPVFAWL